MTRINAGVDPKELTRQHLLAEHREIKRIPNSIVSGKAKVKNIPEQFCLGTGHVKFFYNKLGYLKKRYVSIYGECVNRGYNVTNYIDAWNGVPESLMMDWTPSDIDREIIQRRIEERLNSAS
jgi:deoxyribonuclease (pyrimidine dimer)